MDANGTLEPLRSPDEAAWLDAFRQTYLSTTVPSQSIADEILETVFDNAFTIVLEHYFDRQAVPYAVTWATKQMTDALFACFQGPDRGVVAARTNVVDDVDGSGATRRGGWHADPEPSRVPMDACSRSILRVITRPRPDTPEEEGEDLDATVATLAQTKSSRMLSKRNLSRHTSSISGSRHVSSRRATDTQSTQSSVSRSSRRSNDEGARSVQSNASRSDAQSTSTLGSTSISSGKTTAPGDLQTSTLTVQAAAVGGTREAGHVASAPLTPQEDGLLTPTTGAKQAHRMRTQEIERQLEDIFKQHAAATAPGGTTSGAAAAAKPSGSHQQFIVDSTAGRVVLVKPVDHRKMPTAEVHFGVSRGSSAKEEGGCESPRRTSPAQLSPTKISPRGARTKPKSAPTDYFREEHGQQLVCSVKPAIGVAVRERGEVRNNMAEDGNHSSGYGDGRVSKRVFTKIQQSASQRLSSSEGFRDYFPEGRFTTTVTPLHTSLSVNRSVSSSPPQDGGHSLDGLSPVALADPSPPLAADAEGLDAPIALHEQFHSAMAQRAAGVHSHSNRQGVGLGNRHRPPHHLSHGLPHRTHTKGAEAPVTQTSQKLSAPAVLPIRRPDLLPPIHADSSPASGSRHDSPPPPTASPTPSAVQEFVQLQREKDAPHFKPGKAGGTSAVHASQRKDAISFLTQQEQIIKQRRQTKIIIPHDETQDPAPQSRTIAPSL